MSMATFAFFQNELARLVETFGRNLSHDKSPGYDEATDRQIDALVYELYGLTPDEIALVEGGT
jgi:hypothetical protein